MNAAGLHSPRLRAALAVLRDGRPHSTMEIVQEAGVCAVNSVVAELRHHGAEIACQHRHVDGRRTFYYTMTKGPKNA